ncbi:MAG: tetratricopeptide repeat protein [Blastochloris sp.]|nr:tetratricopeptide repeat protein [Blastochloris sp.]
MLQGLQSFDQEREQVNASWAWMQQSPPSAEIDSLILDFADATAYIGDLRFDTRSERIPQLETVLAIVRRCGIKKGEKTALGNLGIAYGQIGDPMRAMAFYREQLRLAYETNNRHSQVNAYGNIGEVYARQGNFQAARKYFEKALAIGQSLGDKQSIGPLLGNLGVVHDSLGDLRKAKRCYEHALDIAQKRGERRRESNVLCNLGIISKSREI